MMEKNWIFIIKGISKHTQAEQEVGFSYNLCITKNEELHFI